MPAASEASTSTQCRVMPGRASAGITPTGAARLDPSYPVGTPVTPPPGAGFGGDALALAEQIGRGRELIGLPAGASGSNNWAVSGERSATGGPLGPNLGGPGYGQVKLALLNECLGRTHSGPIVFGCHAPDSGNSEILAHYGTPELKEQYLRPAIAGTAVTAMLSVYELMSSRKPPPQVTSVSRGAPDRAKSRSSGVADFGHSSRATTR